MMKGKEKLSITQQKYNKFVEKNYMKKGTEASSEVNELNELVEENKSDSEGKHQHLIKQYEKLKKEFQRIDHDETLKKYEVLSKAHKLGKKIYGAHYSIAAMSIHFEIPYTTCKRIMSLERANENTWKQIHSGKLSAFKAAQICLTKNHDKQDDIVKAVIRDNLSTYQIKKLDVKDKQEFKEQRLNMAMQKGFARESTAYNSLMETIIRLEKLLDIEKDKLPNKKMSEIIEALENLKDKIEHKVDEWTDIEIDEEDDEDDE